MTEVTIWTDGACSGNPGPGGWAAILRCGAAEKVLSGGEASTTNNRRELTAVIKALEALKRPCRVTLYSDLTYAGITSEFFSGVPGAGTGMGVSTGFNGIISLHAGVRVGL